TVNRACRALRTGTWPTMTDPRLADHEMGLELQLVELEEQRRRAEVQGRQADAADLTSEIEKVQLELAATAERIAGLAPPVVVDAERHDGAA
nr:hypothetical protein [Actinomycetota bacterium]